VNKNLRIVFLAVLVCIAPIGCTKTANGPEVQGAVAGHVRNFLTDVEPGLRPGARLACSLYLDYAVTPQDRVDLTNNIHVISSIIAGTTLDTSPGDLSKRIQAALPPAKESKEVADAVSGGWGVAVPFVHGDPALLVKVTQDLAGGCADSTQ